MTSTDPIDARLDANWTIVLGQVLAPTPSRFERLLRRVGVPERAARLAAATPVLRTAWLLAVGGVLLFATAAGNTDGGAAAPADLAVLLAIAPLIPVLAVALSYGAHHDPAHEVRLAAAMPAWRVLLIRTLTVVGVSVAITLLAALAAPAGGWWRLAWLLPCAACVSATLALAARVSLWTAASIVGGVWLTTVVISTQVGDALTPFGTMGQLLAATVAAGGAALLVAQRRSFDAGWQR